MTNLRSVSILFTFIYLMLLGPVLGTSESKNNSEKIASLIQDLNEDGHLDVFYFDPSRLTLRIAFGVGDGTFHETDEQPVLSKDVVQVDLNGDGFYDLVALHPKNEIGIYRGNEEGHFSKMTAIVLDGDTWTLDSFRVADMNEDGHSDIVGFIRTQTSDTASIMFYPFRNNGDGLFGPMEPGENLKGISFRR